MVNFHDCHESLVRTSGAATDVDTRSYEGNLDTVPQLAHVLQGIASTAVEVLETIIEVFSAGGTIDPGDTLVDGVGSAVCDTAFMAHWDLRQREGRLVSVSVVKDPWLMIAECASIRRHIIKSMVQVERVLCRETEAAPQLTNSYRSEFQVAVASRNAYLAFNRGIRSIDQRLSGGELDIVRGLRLSAIDIAILIGRPIYQDLRVSDRQLLRSLQDRIFAAIKAPVMNQLGARRLWMDISTGAHLLGRVHERAPLVAYDFDFVDQLLTSLDDAQTLSSEQFERLREFEGRDPDLDQDLANNRRSIRELRGSLVSVHNRLAVVLGRPPIEVPAARTHSISENVGA